MPFELIKSETLIQGRTFKLRRDHLKTPDGRETKFEIIEHGGSVVIIPIDADGNMLFVRQYRHAAGMDLLELPAGTRDGNEPYEDCAAREIREETPHLVADPISEWRTRDVREGSWIDFKAPTTPKVRLAHRIEQGRRLVLGL